MGLLASYDSGDKPGQLNINEEGEVPSPSAATETQIFEPFDIPDNPTEDSKVTSSTFSN